MESLKKNFNQPTLFEEMCGVARGAFAPHIDPREAAGVREPCPAIGKDIVSCKNPQQETFFREVDGLALETVEMQQPTMEFFPVIPIIDRGLFDLPASFINSKVVGISLKDVFFSPPMRKAGRQTLSPLVVSTDILRRPAFKGKTVVLFSTGRDVLIERIWQKFYTLDFPATIRRMGFAAVGGINFSVFFGECPVGQNLNIKKSLKSVELFSEAGLTVIPHVYFGNQFQLERWLQWLKNNPRVGTITVNCQFHRWDNSAITEQGIIYLLESVGRKLTVILEGPSPAKMPKLFHEYGSSLIVAMKGISLDAGFHQQYQIVGARLKRINAPTLSVADILNLNINAYTQYVEGLIK